MLQAARCSGYHAQLPTIVPRFDAHWGYDCVEWKNTHWDYDCMEWKNTEYKERGEKYTWSSLFFASKPCITIRVGAAMLA